MYELHVSLGWILPDIRNSFFLLACFTFLYLAAPFDIVRIGTASPVML